MICAKRLCKMTANLKRADETEQRSKAREKAKKNAFLKTM
jgi:hypothetical protein